MKFIELMIGEHASMHMFAYVCASECVYVCVCLCVCTCVRVRVHARACLCVCVLMCNGCDS